MIYPADWETEPLTGERSAIAQRKITLHPSRFVTAACLLLTVGIAGGVAWMQISAQKPLSTMQAENASTTAPIVEELMPETTAEQTALTAPQTNAVSPQTTEAPVKVQYVGLV